MCEQKNCYGQYCQANKILHLTASEQEAQIIEKVVREHSFYRKIDDETKIRFAGRMGDDYDYCPSNLEYGNLPSDEVVFPEKNAYSFFSTDFSKYDMVIVWHSTDVQSLVFFYCMCHKFMRSGIPLYEVDIRLARELATEYARKCLNWVHDDYYVSIESLGPRFMMDAPKQVVEVTKERLMEYDALWKAMIDNPTGLRALKEGKVVSVPEDYYDELILSLFPEDGGFKRCVHVVGESLSNLPIEEDSIGAEFFFERLIDLSQMGKLELQLKDDFDFKAYKATKMLMEGFSEGEFDKGWLHYIWPPMQAFMVRRL